MDKRTADNFKKIQNRLQKIPVKNASNFFDGNAKFSDGFWAVLGDSDPTAASHYKWTMQAFDAGSWADRSPTIDSETLYSAREINDVAGLSGMRVKLKFVGYDGDENPVYVFVTGAATGLIPVTLTPDGGGDGDASTVPTYTYKWPVNVITGVEIKNADASRATALSPAWARSIGSYNQATHGTVYINSDGDPSLWQVDETEQVCE